MRKPSAKPPKWAEMILAWYCKPELLEDLQGDLNEYFERHYKKRGLRYAQLIYCIDVLKFCRIYTLRTPEFFNLLTQTIMLKSYIKTSGQSIIRTKLFSFINIIGLAISMSVGLLLIGFLTDLLSYDKFHKNYHNIYRVISDHQFLDNKPSHMASTSVKAGMLLQENLAGVEQMVIMRGGFGADVQYESNVVPISGLYSTRTFFNVFTFPLLSGNPATALKDPYSVVITVGAAKKLFGDQEALGKTITLKNGDSTRNNQYVITGVMKDIPDFSHMKFEALVSFETIRIQEESNEEFLSWESIWMNYVYLVIPDKKNVDNVAESINQINEAENKLIQNNKYTIKLQALSDVVLGEDLSNQIGPTMDVSIVYVVGALALIVILSACFNYTNLSIARALRRSREVGIRKVMGALRSQIQSQFVVESIIVSMAALVLSFVMFLFLRSYFLSITDNLQKLVKLELNVIMIVGFIVLALVVGIVAGFLPALFFSRLQAVKVLKDASSVKLFRKLNMRKALIVVQYTFSLMFIAATIIGYNQYKHFLSFNLGFTTSNILNINMKGNKPELLVKALEEMPEVKAISKSLMIISIGNYYVTQIKYNNRQDSSRVHFNNIDHQYIPLHGHKILAGRNFTQKAEDVKDTEVIVNEQVLKRFNIAHGDPMKAIGEQIIVNGKESQIIGVVKDFHYGKVDSEILPVIFRYENENAGFINASIHSTDWPSTLSKLEREWRKIDVVHPLEAVFYDDQIAESYNDFSAMVKIIGFLAFLAISIASLGMLGMVVFTTETRIKEISIRKVLGATEANLIFLLSRGFLLLLLLSAIIALPTTYYFFEEVVLASIVYHAPITLGELLTGLLCVAVIAFIMIGSQTFRVARANPATVLKNE